MNVVYSKEPFPKRVLSSIFLAGPTPRDYSVQDSWRPEALSILEEMGYQGTVFVPEERSGPWDPATYERQVAWEWECLEAADVICFWVPRNMDTMPALTTNVEFGRFVQSGKIVLGAPPDAQHVRYLSTMLQEQQDRSTYTSLSQTLQACLTSIQNTLEQSQVDSLRVGGDAHIPLHIWSTPTFQSWYAGMVHAGNQIRGAKVLWRHKDFAWALQVDVYVQSENRIQDVEFVLSRTDLSSVLLYRRDQDPLSSECLLIEEFRTGVRNDIGKVRQLPGGSSEDTSDPFKTALEELAEEVGLPIAPDRVKPHRGRQDHPTFGSQHTHLFSVEVSEEEMAQLRADSSTNHGVGDERISFHVRSYKELLQDPNLSWGTLGMLAEVLLG